MGGNEESLSSDGGPGLYRISAGRLDAGLLTVGWVEDEWADVYPGQFAIADPAAEVYVSTDVVLGEVGTLSTVPGAEIHMTGSRFVNESTDANACAGLANLALIFEGGAGVVDTFEAAGRDLGNRSAGLGGNFAAC